jgi:hypothetical protein
MRRLALSLGAILIAAACGSSVTTTETGPAAGGAAASGGGGKQVDQDCYDACVGKGIGEAECTELCSSSSSGKGGDGAGMTTSGSSGSGGYIDPDLEKACFECWYDVGDDFCTEELETCEKSLACGQLRDCPFACKGTPECIGDCQEIIPTGVAPLTALVQCMACNNGPCADECAGAVTLVYCD